MIKKNCKWYPCHKNLEDCNLCYCIAYPCEIKETGGKWIKDKINKKIWDCSNCVIVHRKSFVEFLKKVILKTIKEITCN